MSAQFTFVRAPHLPRQRALEIQEVRRRVLRLASATPCNRLMLEITTRLCAHLSCDGLLPPLLFGTLPSRILPDHCHTIKGRLKDKREWKHSVAGRFASVRAAHLLRCHALEEQRDEIFLSRLRQGEASFSRTRVCNIVCVCIQKKYVARTAAVGES